MMNNIKNNFIVSSTYSLQIIALLAVAGMVLSLPFKAHAYSNGYQNRITLVPNNPIPEDEYVQENNPLPAIYSISPTVLVVNSGSRTITVTGKNFIPASIVRIDGTDRATTYVDSNRLTVQTNYSDATTVGTHSMTVFNVNGGTSNTTYLNIKSNVITRTNTTTVYQNKTVNRNIATDTNYSNNSSTFGDELNSDVSSLASNALFGSNSFMPTGLVQWILFAILILLIVIIARKIFVGDKHAHEHLKHA